MRAVLVVAVVAACKQQAHAPPATEGEPPIAMPQPKGSGEAVGVGSVHETRGSAAPTEDLTVASYDRVAMTPMLHLKPDEATLTVSPVDASAGGPATAEISIVPGAGYKLSTEYKTKLQLLDAEGVTLDHRTLRAGGSLAQGDAQALTEKRIAFTVPVTPQAPGTYVLKGVLTVGVCKRDSCMPRSQPITIQIAAK